MNPTSQPGAGVINGQPLLPPPKRHETVEPVVLLLFFGMIFFTGMLFVAERWFAMDGQMFQVIAGLLTGFSGAFFMRVKPRTDEGSSKTTSTTTGSPPESSVVTETHP